MSLSLLRSIWAMPRARLAAIGLDISFLACSRVNSIVAAIALRGIAGALPAPAPVTRHGASRAAEPAEIEQLYLAIVGDDYVARLDVRLDSSVCELPVLLPCGSIADRFPSIKLTSCQALPFLAPHPEAR